MLVSHSAQPGGSNQTIASLLRHRPSDLEAECVFLEDGPAVDQVASLGLAARVIESGRAREAWRAPQVVRALSRAIDQAGAEIVFAHVTKAHLYASPAAKLGGLPYLWWQHERRSQKPVMHLVSAWLPSSAVICSSRWTAAQQRRPRGGEVRAIYPGAELDPPPEAHLHSAGPGGQITVGVVGRLQRWKRVELALRTWPAVLEGLPGARLRVVGAGWPGLDEGYGDELRAEAQRLGIAGSVDFTGHVPDVHRELAQIDVLLHTAQAEPFGLVLVEAMAHAIPVVAVDEGGPAEIVRSGVDGLLTPAQTAPLAAAVLELARDPARRAQMGAVGRERALGEFGAPRMADETWALVRRLLATRPPPRRLS